MCSFFEKEGKFQKKNVTHNDNVIAGSLSKLKTKYGLSIKIQLSMFTMNAIMRL